MLVGRWDGDEPAPVRIGERNRAVNCRCDRPTELLGLCFDGGGTLDAERDQPQGSCLVIARVRARFADHLRIERLRGCNVRGNEPLPADCTGLAGAVCPDETERLPDPELRPGRIAEAPTRPYAGTSKGSTRITAPARAAAAAVPSASSTPVYVHQPGRCASWPPPATALPRRR
jgi:hypothetical protein